MVPRKGPVNACRAQRKLVLLLPSSPVRTMQARMSSLALSAGQVLDITA